MNKQSFMEKAVSWTKKRGGESVRVCMEGYEHPKAFLNKRTQEEVMPDITFIAPGGAKHYTEIALKNDQPQKLVTKWKLLSMLASMKQGKLHLLAPKGHKMFTQNLVRKYNINAFIYSL